MATIEGWSEAAILSLMFVAALAIVVANFNVMYDQNNALPFTDNSGAEQLFIDYQTTTQTQIEGGEVQFDASQGITLKSSWGLAKDAVNICWGFVSGGWIESIASSWNLGDSGMLVARGFRIIWILSIIFAILYALFKVIF